MYIWASRLVDFELNKFFALDKNSAVIHETLTAHAQHLLREALIYARNRAFVDIIVVKYKNAQKIPKFCENVRRLIRYKHTNFDAILSIFSLIFNDILIFWAIFPDNPWLEISKKISMIFQVFPGAHEPWL